MPGAKFRIKRKCKECGNEFFIKTLDSVYCCKRCSNIALKRRKREDERERYLEEIAKAVPSDAEFLTIHEASAIFEVSIWMLYRLERKGAIRFIKTQGHKSLVDKKELSKMFPTRKQAKVDAQKLAKLYNMEPENCYTIGEVSLMFDIKDCTVYHHIRKYSIPTRQIGNFVYVPKEEIDNLYKSLT